MPAALSPMFAGLSPTDGSSPSAELALSARVMPEGVLLSWPETPRDTSGVLILANTRHPPQNATDGRVVLETYARPSAPHILDARALPETFECYTLFVRELGQWVQPVGCTAVSWTGAPIELEEDPTSISTLAESVGSYARSALVSNVALHPAGSWLRLGPYDETRDLSRIVTKVVGSRVYFAPLPHLGAPTALAYYGRELVIGNSNGGPVLERKDGRAWADEGWTTSKRAVISGAPGATGADGPRGVLEVNGALLFLDGAVFAGTATTRAARVAEEPGLLVGAPVTRLNSLGPRLARQLYRDMTPTDWQKDDEATGQVGALVEATLDDGQIANVGARGQNEHAYQRFLRLVGLALSWGASSWASLRQLLDIDTAPVEFLRGSSAIGYRPPDDVDDIRARALLMQRPGLVRSKGVEATLYAQIAATLAQDVTILHGGDRVIRLCELGNGLVGCWQGVPTGLSANTLTDAWANYVASALVGWRVAVGVETWRALLEANTATALTTVATAPVLTTAGSVRTGTADAPTPYYGDGGANGLLFDAAGQYIERLDGANWNANGYAVNQHIRTQGAANAANNGWQIIASFTGAKAYVTGGTTLVNETATRGIVDGGITEHDLCDVDANWPVDGLIGNVVTPATGDAYGLDGRPRWFEIVANKARRLTITGGTLSAVAALGSAYRIAPRYAVAAPYGGRQDPRRSVYSFDPGSAFNDRGVFAYAAADPGVSARAELRERVGLCTPARVTIEVVADGGGDLVDDAALPSPAVNVDLLEVEAAA